LTLPTAAAIAESGQTRRERGPSRDDNQILGSIWEMRAISSVAVSGKSRGGGGRGAES